MNAESFIVNISNEDVIVRINETSFGQVKVTPSVIGKVNVIGGVPGPPGKDGVDGLNGGINPVLLNEHVVDLDPHPAYDDLPSMTLLFENGLI